MSYARGIRGATAPFLARCLGGTIVAVKLVTYVDRHGSLRDYPIAFDPEEGRWSREAYARIAPCHDVTP